MKVLLLGEFSGYFTNLKRGLEELGVDCLLASNKDGWKSIDGTDTYLQHGYDSRFGYIKSQLFEPLRDVSRFWGFDVVQFVHPVLFSPIINREIVKSIIGHNEKTFISVAGDSYYLYKTYKEGKLGYYIYDNNPELSSRYTGESIKSKMYISQEDWLYQKANGIIPVMYEYALGVRDFKNCRETIPLPFDSNSVRYEENIPKGKIVIMHGLIREKCKGSAYIINALNRLKEKYPNDVEIIIDGKMPLDEYLSKLRRANILVDQCKEHCWGMNACYAMAQGKIVLGGASYNSLKEFGLSESPIIHITPDEDQIFSQLAYAISERNNFEQRGYESRKFVETFHNHIKIAERYIKTWEE